MRNGGDNFAFDWNGVLNDFPVEGFAEEDAVVKSVMRRWVGFVVAIEPELNLVEEVEASRIYKKFVPSSVRPEEDRGGEDPLERCSDSAVLSAIFWEMEIIEQLSWTVEMKGAGLLPVSKSGEPDRNQAILPVRDGRFIMHLPQ